MTDHFSSRAASFASMSDHDLFHDAAVMVGDYEGQAALQAEREKRTRAKEQERLAEERERQRVEQERIERLRQRKDALQYEDRLAQEICERIAVGELLINVCEELHMPTLRRCNQWLREHPEFQELFNQSISDRLNVFEEEVVKIADDIKNDFKTIIKNGREKRVPDQEMVARARLRIEVRFKHLKALRPQRWGETSTLITKSADGFDPSNFSQEQLEQEIAAIEAKSRSLRPQKVA